MSQVRGYGFCPKCDRCTMVRTSCLLPLWECLNPECGIFCDSDGTITEPQAIKEEVK